MHRKIDHCLPRQRTKGFSRGAKKRGERVIDWRQSRAPSRSPSRTRVCPRLNTPALLCSAPIWQDNASGLRRRYAECGAGRDDRVGWASTGAAQSCRRARFVVLERPQESSHMRLVECACPAKGEIPTEAHTPAPAATAMEGLPKRAGLELLNRNACGEACRMRDRGVCVPGGEQSDECVSCRKRGCEGMHGLT